MKTLVAIKQLAGRDAHLRIRPDGRWIQEEDLPFEINEPDAYALEAALQLKEKAAGAGEVVALCAGPERATKAIREALAKGADRAIHIEVEALEQLDALAVARLLAEAARTEQPDLILTGLQSDDIGAGQTGVILAELLGLAHATIIVDISPIEGGLRLRRELEGGWFQQIDVPLPALLTIQSGICKLRYATLMGIKKARAKQVKRIGAAELVANVKPLAVVQRIYPPERVKQTQMIEGEPAEAAKKLVDKLKSEARIL